MTIIDRPRTTARDLKRIFEDIEEELNKVAGITDASKRYHLKPIESHEGGFAVCGGPDNLMYRKPDFPEKEMRFTELGDWELHAKWSNFYPYTKEPDLDAVVYTEFKEPDRKMFNSKISYDCAMATYRNTKSDMGHLRFKSNHKDHHWTYEEACAVERCFRKAGFKGKPTSKSNKYTSPWKKAMIKKI